MSIIAVHGPHTMYQTQSPAGSGDPADVLFDVITRVTNGPANYGDATAGTVAPNSYAELSLYDGDDIDPNGNDWDATSSWIEIGDEYYRWDGNDTWEVAPLATDTATGSGDEVYFNDRWPQSLEELETITASTVTDFSGEKYVYLGFAGNTDGDQYHWDTDEWVAGPGAA